jgi:hypothetical protein
MVQTMTPKFAEVTYECPKGRKHTEGYDGSSIEPDRVSIDEYVECPDCKG